MWRIAVLHHGSATSPALAALRAGLRHHGLLEGVDCRVDAAGARGCWTRLPALALLARGPDVVVAIGALAALAARQGTERIPILHAVVLDPVEIGLVASHVCGVSTYDAEQAPCHLKLLRELLPQLRRVAYLTDVQAPVGPHGDSPLVRDLEQAAALQEGELTRVAWFGLEPDLHEVFSLARRARVEAVLALEVPAVLARLEEIARLAAAERWPTLMPYGCSTTGLGCRTPR